MIGITKNPSRRINIRPTPFWSDRDEGQTDYENEEEEDGFNDPGREDEKRNK